MVVFGTRPEAIKMCPLVLELKRRNKYKVIVCVTGQHKEMLQPVLDIFNVKPDYDLHIMREEQSLFDITNNIMLKMEAVLKECEPDLVLVHGDTSTSFAAALSCYYKKIEVGHVEAGLRTYDIYSPYPEEFNRQAVDIIAKYKFVPTELTRNNLLNEGKAKGSIFVTGNTVIDALKTTIRVDYSHKELEWVGNSRLILITAHRRENIGNPMRNMFRAIRRVCKEFQDIKVIYPIHMNPAVRSIAQEIFVQDDQIHIIEPLNVLDFHNFMSKSYIILTDSGGIQEEASALSKPVLVMRGTTERPEGISAGTLRLVGTEENSIYSNFKQLLLDSTEYLRMSQARNPYGDGHASEKIADIIENIL